MLARYPQLACCDKVRLLAVQAEYNSSVSYKRAVFRLGLLRKIKYPCPRKLRHVPHYGIVVIQRGKVVLCLVFKAAALCGNVILHLVPEAVQMVLRNVQHAERIRMEVRNAFKLQCRRLGHNVIPRLRFARMRRYGHAYVAQHKGMLSGSLE